MSGGAAGGQVQSRSKRGRGQIMRSHRSPVKESGWCPVGNGSLGTVWDPCEGLKPGGRESGKRSLAFGDLPPSRASLAI